MNTYHGSCHCGAVRYEADIDLACGTVKCNCSICTKMRFWAFVTAPSRFRLLAGTDHLREYRFHTRRDGHHFCGQCGINVFSTGTALQSGPFVAVTVASLDDLPLADLLTAPVRHIDGERQLEHATGRDPALVNLASCRGHHKRSQARRPIGVAWVTRRATRQIGAIFLSPVQFSTYT